MKIAKNQYWWYDKQARTFVPCHGHKIIIDFPVEIEAFVMHDERDGCYRIYCAELGTYLGGGRDLYEARMEARRELYKIKRKKGLNAIIAELERIKSKIGISPRYREE